MTDERINQFEDDEQRVAEAAEQAERETVVRNEAETPAEEPTLEELLAAAETKAAENLEGWQRAVAELSNARKRFNQQMQEAHRSATADVVNKLLPVLDDFDRALTAVPESVAEDGWFEGIELVRRKLNGILDSLHVEQIEALGQPFDPNLHEALSSEESDTYESGVVTRELLPGYRIGNRVIRPSLVYVAS